MKIHDIIEHFSSFTTVPIDPDAVADQVMSSGLRDEISFVGVDIDVLALRGALHTYVLRPGVYADPQLCSDIYYAKDQSRAWKRLVCCKELLHILDNSASKTSTEEEFNSLIKGLCSGTTQGIDSDELRVLADKFMVLYALAIVFPFRVREIILAKCHGSEPNLKAVAAWLDLPENVCALVLSDEWVAIYKSLLGNR